MMERAGLEDNDNLYPNSKMKDIQIIVQWGKHFPIESLEGYNSCQTYTGKSEEEKEEKVPVHEDENITLEDCFEEFNKP